jgi:hypothetical protein
MSSSFRLSLDHTGFYRGGAAFFPKIQSAVFPLEEWSDTVLLKLPASLQDDLDWSAEKKIAEQVIEMGKAIFWEIDFQFDARKLAPRQSASFFTYGRALEEFARFCSPFAEHTFGVCLYRGNAEFLSLFDPKEWDEAFCEWIEELAETSCIGHELKVQDREGEWRYSPVGQHYFRLFCVDLFASYLQRLVSFLPDSLLPFAFFDASSIESPAVAAQLFSKERFQYLHLGLKGAEFPFVGLALETEMPSAGWCGDRDLASVCRCGSPALALCLPSDAYCDRAILSQLEHLMHTLRRKAIAFRLICEEKLTEEWNGLDRLIVIPESISAQGKRKLQGFIAAGGEVVENICT